MNKRFVWIAITVAAALVILWIVITRFWTEDKCLDAGGSIDFSGRFCMLADRSVHQVSTPVREALITLAIVLVVAAAVWLTGKKLLQVYRARQTSA